MEGPMRFQAETTYDDRALMALQRVAGQTTRKRYVAMRRGFDYVAGGLMLGDGAILLYLGDYGVLTWLMLVLGMVFLGFGWFYYQLSAYRASRRMPKLEGAREQRFSFYDTTLLCQSEQVETRFELDAFTALYLWEDFLILFVDAQHAIAIDQNRMTVGAAPELCQFLARKTRLDIKKLR